MKTNPNFWIQKIDKRSGSNKEKNTIKIQKGNKDSLGIHVLHAYNPSTSHILLMRKIT